MYDIGRSGGCRTDGHEHCAKRGVRVCVVAPFRDCPQRLFRHALFANMLAQAGVASQAVGSATLRLSSDGVAGGFDNSVTSGLTSKVRASIFTATRTGATPARSCLTSMLQHAAGRPFHLEHWPVGTLSAADVVEIIARASLT